MAVLIESRPAAEAGTELRQELLGGGTFTCPAYGTEEAVFVALATDANKILEEIALLPEVDVRPLAEMSEWSAELDAESRAIHADLARASFRALVDD